MSPGCPDHGRKARIVILSAAKDLATHGTTPFGQGDTVRYLHLTPIGDKYPGLYNQFIRALTRLRAPNLPGYACHKLQLAALVFR